MKQIIMRLLEVVPCSGKICILSYGSFSDDSRSQVWIRWIILEWTQPFRTKLDIQVKLMKTKGYKWWTIMYHVRILIWTQNWSNSASEFWKNRIISESACYFLLIFSLKVKADHYASFLSSLIFWKNLHPELWIIFGWFQITVLDPVDYLRIDSTISNET